MKNLTIAIFLATGLVMPVMSQAGTYSDQIHASFERDLNRQAATGASRHVANSEVDPLPAIFNAALRDNGSYQLLASFKRDLNRQPTVGTSRYIAGSEVDPLQQYFNVVLSNDDLWLIPQRKTAIV